MGRLYAFSFVFQAALFVAIRADAQNERAADRRTPTVLATRLAGELRAPQPRAHVARARFSSEASHEAPHAPVRGDSSTRLQVSANPPPAPDLAAPRPEVAHLTKDVFQDAIHRSTLRDLDAHLSDGAFEKKWRAARESPEMFFRSFPNAFYRDLKGIDRELIPGRSGIVFGDPHPNNFGYIRIGRGQRYVFNDLDDSGQGPIALDALRYFTALRLSAEGKHFVDETLDAYLDALAAHPRSLAKPKTSLTPDWKSVARETLAKYTEDDKLRISSKNRLSSITDKQRDVVTASVLSQPALRVDRVLDVATRVRDFGGSGGLRRYWLLVERKGARTILELKEEGTPGIEQLGQPALPTSERLAVLKDAFWSNPSPDDYIEAEIDGARYIARDRLRMTSIDLSELGDRKLQSVLRAQASVMASLHGAGWQGIAPDEIRTWLKKSSKTLAARWTEAYEQAK